MRRNRKPVFTHPLEEDLDRDFGALQSQVNLLEKLQRVFGENPSDPVVRFQFRKMKKNLESDIRKLALTGVDLHNVQETLGADLFKGEVLRARREIAQEK